MIDLRSRVAGRQNCMRLSVATGATGGFGVPREHGLAVNALYVCGLLVAMARTA